MKVSDTHAKVLELRPKVAEIVPGERIFTVKVADEFFGMPVSFVHTVFKIDELTPIPLAPAPVVGLVNLRGRVVTALSLRRRLGLEFVAKAGMIAIGIEYQGEALALVVDEAGDVLDLGCDEEIEPPRHMRSERARLTKSVFRLDDGLLSILDMTALFEMMRAA